jgi:hypothetical protein
MHSNGETFSIDAANQPENVTDVRLRTINNHGDLYYVGAREFSILGPSVTVSTIFEAAMNSDGETFTLAPSAQPEGVTDIRLVTISNHGDPYYIGAREIEFLGLSVTETKTFTAAMHANGETFTLDNNDIPPDVTDAKLITINNHGDSYYIGLSEFELIGDSVGPSHTFTLAMSSSVQTIALDNDDTVSNVIGAKLVTIKNHGDPYYTGMAEFGLRGTPVTPSYVFEAQMNSTSQTLPLTNSDGKVLRFHSLNNYGDPYYIGAAQFASSSGACIGDVQLDHIQIQHSNSALTCTPAQLTVKACADVSCTNVTATDVEVNLSTTGGASSWSQNPITIPGGSTAGVNVNLTHTSAETITLNATSTPAATNTVECSPNCNLTFNASGYLATLANHQSCNNTDLVIQAVKLSDTGISCAPAYTGDQSIDFIFNYVSPSSGTKLPTLNSTAMASGAASQNKTVNFDNTGTATLAFNYADAGQININISDAGSAGLAATTVTTVATPAQLLFASPDANALCPSADAQCSVFKAASAPFSLSIMAACADNTLTPNFALNNIALSVDTVAPILGNPVLIGVNSVSISEGNSGLHTIANQTVSEVGVFTITATPTANSYFGTTVPTSTSGNIGRFTPSNFTLDTSIEGSLSSSQPFVYTGQMDSTTPTNGHITYALVPAFTITAKSQTGDTTLNYADTFAKIIESDIVRVTPISDSSTLGADNTNMVNLSANLGTAVLTSNAGVTTYQFATDDHFVYTRQANAIIGPFTSDIDLQITTVIDSDNVTANDTDGNAANGVLTLQPTGLDVRFGQWIIDNNYGPATANVAIPMTLQYFDGNKFVLNSSDDFTTFDFSDAIITDIDLAPAITTAIGSGTFVAGQTYTVQLLPPGSGAQGSVKFSIEVPNWLKYDWQNSDSLNDGPYLDNPFATATFGIFGGNNRVIYWREKQ